jgi:hypothetical protein
MRKWVLLLLLLISCVSQPYVQPGMNATEEKVVEKVLVQCWDNSTAASVEQCPKKVEGKTPAKIIVEAPTIEPEHVSIAKKMLADAKSKFTSYAYLLDDRMVIVSGNKVRHYFLRMHELDSKTSITDVYVDSGKKEAVAYCNIEREGRDMSTDQLDWERSKCKDYIDKPISISYEEWAPHGPLDYLEEYANLEPILVEDNVQTLSVGGNQKSIQPSLHYMVDGKRVVLRIDRRYQVPIKIEREGQQSIDFRDTFFDTMVLNSKQLKIDDSWVTYQPVSDYWKKAPAK